MFPFTRVSPWQPAMFAQACNSNTDGASPCGPMRADQAWEGVLIQRTLLTPKCSLPSPNPPFSPPLCPLPCSTPSHLHLPHTGASRHSEATGTWSWPLAGQPGANLHSPAITFCGCQSVWYAAGMLVVATHGSNRMGGNINWIGLKCPLIPMSTISHH